MSFHSPVSASAADNPSFLPKSMLILSGSSLKLLACVIMLIDHSAAYFIGYYKFAQVQSISILGQSMSLYRLMRDIGRLAFPIYCFLLVEGFEHTGSRLKYARNLLLFALISELPWNLAHGSLHHPSQNVYFTLFFGFMGMFFAELFDLWPLLQVMSMFALLLFSARFNADYSYRGYILIMIMYWLRKHRPAQALIATSWLHYEWVAGFSFIFINMYNGARGFIRSKAAKYGFYFFYPAHIFILWLLRRLLLGLR